jgi:hypothetical protein
MTLANGWKIAIGVLLTVFVTVGSWAWLTEHDARLKAEATTAVQQKTIDGAQAAAQQTAAQLNQSLAALEAEKAKPATPQQIIIDASKLMPNLPQPITIQTAPAAPVIPGNNPVNTGSGQAPGAASTPQQQLVIPEVDFKAIQDAEIGCQENAASLSACQLTAADVQVELKTTSAQRDEWEKTAKGGTWLHRTVTAAKWIAIGGAVGYVAGHKF